MKRDPGPIPVVFRLCTLLCTFLLFWPRRRFSNVPLVIVFIGDPGWIRTSDPQLRRLMLIDYLFAGLEQGTSSIVGEQFPISDVPAQHGVAGMPRLGFDLEC